MMILEHWAMNNMILNAFLRCSFYTKWNDKINLINFAVEECSVHNNSNLKKSENKISYSSCQKIKIPMTNFLGTEIQKYTLLFFIPLTPGLTYEKKSV